jgi:hypothetical protein
LPTVNYLTYTTVALGFIWAFGISRGFELRKWYSWIFVASGFFAGAIQIFAGVNLFTGLGVGLSFAILAIIMGPSVLYVRREFMGWIMRSNKKNHK